MSLSSIFRILTEDLSPKQMKSHFSFTQFLSHRFLCNYEATHPIQGEQPLITPNAVRISHEQIVAKLLSFFDANVRHRLECRTTTKIVDMPRPTVITRTDRIAIRGVTIVHVCID